MKIPAHGEKVKLLRKLEGLSKSHYLRNWSQNLTAFDKAKAVSIVNVNGKVKILEAIAQGSIDVIKVADTESKLVEESAIKVAIAP